MWQQQFDYSPRKLKGKIEKKKKCFIDQVREASWDLSDMKTLKGRCVQQQMHIILCVTLSLISF